MKRVTDSVAGRVYDPTLLLDSSVVRAVLQRFRQEVPQIFGQDLVFGCIVGGFAKGYAVGDQDIDMFVCVHKINEELAQRYKSFYLNLHEEFSLVPDLEVPGELVTLDVLQQKLDFLNERPLRPDVESYYEYEAILWAEMLSGPKAALVGDFGAMDHVFETCEIFPQKWRKEIYGLIGEKLDIETAKLSTHQLFKKARRMGCLRYLKKNMQSNSISDAYDLG